MYLRDPDTQQIVMFDETRNKPWVMRLSPKLSHTQILIKAVLAVARIIICRDDEELEYEGEEAEDLRIKEEEQRIALKSNKKVTLVYATFDSDNNTIAIQTRNDYQLEMLKKYWDACWDEELGNTVWGGLQKTIRFSRYRRENEEQMPWNSGYGRNPSGLSSRPYDSDYWEKGKGKKGKGKGRGKEGKENEGKGNRDKHKTAMCRMIESGRNCRFGDNCWFAHSTEELRVRY